MGAYPSYHISSGTHFRPVVFKIAIYGKKTVLSAMVIKEQREKLNDCTHSGMSEKLSFASVNRAYLCQAPSKQSKKKKKTTTNLFALWC